MSKRAEEKAIDAWAVYEYREHPKGLYHTCFVDGYKEGYEQAIKEVTRKIHKYVATRFIANRDERELTAYAAERTEEDKLIMDYIEKLEKEYE